MLIASCVWCQFAYRWGSPYLTRDFFHIMGSKMGDQVLLVVAEEGDELVAGALNLIGGDTLFGRLWGCHPRTYYPSLHFEACYYQVHMLTTSFCEHILNDALLIVFKYKVYFPL